MKDVSWNDFVKGIVVDKKDWKEILEVEEESVIVSAVKKKERSEHVIVATFDNGDVKEVIRFYPDEISIYASEVVGITQSGASALFCDKDTAYLRS